jgi:arsenite oxidase small subunit
MKTCPIIIDVGRRKFLTGAGIAAAGAAAATVVPQKAAASPQAGAASVSVESPRER